MSIAKVKPNQLVEYCLNLSPFMNVRDGRYLNFQKMNVILLTNEFASMLVIKLALSNLYTTY